ncbi:MAG: TetR/AcrR family transcriptional regulator [Parvibaculum sp.]|nr:TetR/AcrR family transcriptional regulator [Parvibaculum sp.]
MSKILGKKGVETAPRRQRLAPEERRAQIIAAARALFGEGGLAALSMRSIAARVGITQAAIYQHFEDKEAIVFAVAEHFFGKLIESAEASSAAGLAPVEALRASMRGYIETGLAHPEEYRLVFMTDAPGLRRHGPANLQPQSGSEIQPTKGQVAYGHLQEKVRLLMKSGDIRKGDPELIAEAMWAAGHGIVSLLITHVEFVWDAQRLIDTHVDILLKGLLPDDHEGRKASAKSIRKKA